MQLNAGQHAENAGHNVKKTRLGTKIAQLQHCGDPKLPPNTRQT
jgi:hypothetical protein